MQHAHRSDFKLSFVPTETSIRQLLKDLIQKMAGAQRENIKVALQSIRKNHLSTACHGMSLEWNQKTENRELCTECCSLLQEFKPHAANGISTDPEQYPQYNAPMPSHVLGQKNIHKTPIQRCIQNEEKKEKTLSALPAQKT